MQSVAGSTFQILVSTIYWEGKNSSPQAVAAEILRRSRAPRMNARPVAEVCAELTGGAPLPFIRDPEAMSLAEAVMSAVL